MDTRKLSKAKVWGDTASIMCGLYGAVYGVRSGSIASAGLKQTNELIKSANISGFAPLHLRRVIMAAYGIGGYIVGGSFGGVMGCFAGMYADKRKPVIETDISNNYNSQNISDINRELHERLKHM